MKDMLMRLFKAVVTVGGHKEEVPVWAESLDQAHDQAEAEYGEVDRVRPTELTQ